jgi:glycosyltransferase involved in cell wall biosynthesis
MAADPDGFEKMSRTACRRKLGLSMEAKFVGYCGSMYRNRGISTLFDAMEEVRKIRPNTGLVLSGRKERHVRLPAWATWLGYLPDDQVPCLLNAVDVLCIINTPSSFGSYSYPAKLYEAMRCGVPLVASDTPPARWILGNREEHLVTPNDPAALAEKLLRVIDMGEADYGPQPSWEDSADRLEQFLSSPLNDAITVGPTGLSPDNCPRPPH